MARPKRPKYIHLPEEIYTLELTDKQKLVFSNIASIVSNGGSYEFDNLWVSEWLGISTRSASGIVNALVKKGYISSDLIYRDGTKQIAKRVLKLTSIGMELLKVTPRNMKGDGGIEVDFPDNNKDSSTPVINNNKGNTDTVLAEFEKFWDLYDFKQDRDKVFQKFKNIPASEYPAIFEYLPEYVKRTHKDGTYPSRRHPQTWLNNTGWRNELPATEDSAKDMWEEKLKEKYATK